MTVNILRQEVSEISEGVGAEFSRGSAWLLFKQRAGSKFSGEGGGGFLYSVVFLYRF